MNNFYVYNIKDYIDELLCQTKPSSVGLWFSSVSIV